MPDIHFGGDAFAIDVEQDPWEPEPAAELQALVGKPFPEFRIPTTETTDVLLPLHELPRARHMFVFLPHIATPKHPLPEHLADLPLARAGVQIHEGVHDEYENLASIGYHYTLLVTTQDVDELRKIIRPEPRQQFPGLSDSEAKLADILGAPTFEVDGKRYYEPFAVILKDGLVEKVVHPIPEPTRFARWAFNWARVRRPDLDFLNYSLDRGSFTRRNG